jgi:hypothetical protein
MKTDKILKIKIFKIYPDIDKQIFLQLLIKIISYSAKYIYKRGSRSYTIQGRIKLKRI